MTELNSKTTALTVQLAFIARLNAGSDRDLTNKGQTVQVDTVQDALDVGMSVVTELFGSSKLSSDMLFIATINGKVVGTGSAVNGATIYTPTATEQAQLDLIEVQFRKSAFEVLNGIQVKKAVDSEEEALEVDAALGFTNQKGIYAGSKVMVCTYVKKYDGGKESGAELRMVTRHAFQPKDSLRLSEGHLPVYLAGSVQTHMGDKEEAHQGVLRFVSKFMKGAGKFNHFIGGRKNILVFCDRPFGGYAVHNVFSKLDINRMEHLIQVVLARGIKLLGGTRIKMPKHRKSVIADGVMWGLTLEDGQTLGLAEGMYQIRAEGIIGKGTIHVSRRITESFTNLESIKVKDVSCEWLDPADILFIGNSESVFTMKISHQIGYLFMDSYLTGKVTTPWGNIPDEIAANIKSTDDGSMSDTVRAAAPVEMSRLEGLGFDRQFLNLPDTAVTTAVKFLRPPAFKMYMLSILPIDVLDRTFYKQAGIYPPEPMTLDGVDEGDYFIRSPFLAVGGGGHEIHTKDAKGKSMYRGFSSELNVFQIVMHEPNADGSYPDDVENKGNGASRILRKMLDANGADADGDRVARSTLKGDLMLKSAGIVCDYNVTIIKTKNPYPGIVGWDLNAREMMWVCSTPLLRLVGVGDKITRNLVDLVFSNVISRAMWDRAKLAGAEVVQKGVSAPKYFMKAKYRAPFTVKAVSNMMSDKGVEAGFDFKGLLYAKARAAVQAEFNKVYPAIHTTFLVRHAKRAWEGGYSSLWDKLALFNQEMGDAWVTHVKRSFTGELVRMNTIGLEGDTLTAATTKYLKLLQSGGDRARVRAYIAQFIHDHKETLGDDDKFLTDHSAVWAWMLSHEFIRPDLSGSMPAGHKVMIDGTMQPAPWECPEGLDGRYRILEIMGLPFNATALMLREEKRLLALDRQ